MGVLDKIKNIFFEEEYVEEEKKVRKPRKEQKKAQQIKEPVAKKIDLPEIKKEERTVKNPRMEEIKEEVLYEKNNDFSDHSESISDTDLLQHDSGFKFPMVFEEEDFREEPVRRQETVVEIKEEKPVRNNYMYETERMPLYEGGLDTKENKQVFKPTPIISPIYGVLDKNYKKEEIITKKEIVLSSSHSRKADLDAVREKAYGDLASDITSSIMEEDTAMEEKYDIDDSSKLYDLNNDSPAVQKVTVGDAEEYFNDLGLEYNIDYKDTSLEKATGRRSEKIEKDIDDDTTLENNLFDLIDSMYEDKEE